VKGEILIDDRIKAITDESFTSDYINSEKDYKRSDNNTGGGSHFNYMTVQ